MLPSEVNDAALLRLIKEKQDSEAIQLLTERHTGIYTEVVKRYTYVPALERQELLDHRMLNIYLYALDYDESRGTKFSTYVGQRTRWQCQTLLKEPANSEFVEEWDSEDDAVAREQIEGRDMLTLLYSAAREVDDPRFAQVFGWRHPLNGDKALAWHKIGKKLGVSPEWARQIYNRHIEQVKRVGRKG